MLILRAGVFEGTGWSAELSFSSGKWIYQNSIAGNCKHQFPPSVELEVLYHQAGKGGLVVQNPVKNPGIANIGKVRPSLRETCLPENG